MPHATSVAGKGQTLGVGVPLDHAFQKNGKGPVFSAERVSTATATPSTTYGCTTIAENAGLSDARPHALRHTCATILLLLDHLQPDAVGLGGGRRFLARVAAVHVRQLDTLAGRLLHSLGERADLRPVLLGGRRAAQSQEVS